MRQTSPFGLNSAADRRLLNFLASSVEVAARVAPAKRGVTPFEDGARLNVGFCEALTLFPNETRILVKETVLPRGLPSRGTVTYPGYMTSPGSKLLKFDADKVPSLAGLLKAVRPAHDAAITVSARRGFNAGARDGHSDGAIRLLSQFVGRPLPTPSFQRTRASVERWEGAVLAAQATRFERSRTARADCLAHYGYHGSGCNLLFEQRYGPEAEGLIHVHHLETVASRRQRYRVDPVRDLRPVCPNCHAVIHSTKPPLSIEALRRMLRRPT